LTAHGPRQELYRDALAQYCAARTLAEIEADAERTGIAILPVYTPDEALRHPQVAARGNVGFFDDPIEGRIAHFVNPLARAGLSSARRTPAPDLAQHSVEILSEHGYSDEDIDRLRAAGVI
jgi:crotonobetainyl-CoA:carnitine CoA-transferase CaiB-like acyl-CoA transferase